MSAEEDDILDHEPSWLTHMLDQRIAQLRHAVGNTLDGVDYTVIMLSLTDPPRYETKRWENSCDHCRQHHPEGAGLLIGNATRKFSDTVLVSLTFGACEPCVRLP